MLKDSVNAIETEENLEYVLNKLVEEVETLAFDCINIFLGHPLDLLKLNMTEFSCFWYFISNSDMKQGELLLVKDEEIKTELYKFAKNNPDRVFRGEKKYE